MEPFQNLAQRRRYWTGHILAWRQSGLKQAEYARQHHVSPKSLSYWSRQGKPRRQICPPRDALSPVCSRKARAEVKFVPLPHELLSPKGATMAPAKLVLRVGPRLRLTIPADLSPDVLSRVVRVLMDL